MNRALKKHYLWTAALVSLLTVLPCRSVAKAGVLINLETIAQIESNCNPMAYNKYSKAAGLYQITPIVLKEYNALAKAPTMAKEALYKPQDARTIAKWYVEHRIPQLLRAKKVQVTVNNTLIAYNAGIRYVGKRRLPKETKEYIRKYYKIEIRMKDKPKKKRLGKDK